MKFFVVAELGCNWWLDDEATREVNFLNLHKMVKSAAEAGFDAVKLQFYKTEEIRELEKSRAGSAYTGDVYKLISRTELSVDEVAIVRRWCRDLNLELVVTPFINPAYVGPLNDLVDRWKIRHRDQDNEGLLKAVGFTYKHVYSSRTDWNMYLPELMGPFTFHQIYCIPKYPASWGDIDCDPSHLIFWEGWSNHIRDPSATLLICANALLKPKREFYVELHYKLARGRPVDDAVSLTPSEARSLIAVLRSWEKAAESWLSAARDRWGESSVIY